jgi:hypothetical protein
MTIQITRADVIPKVDARISNLPVENKVVAQDINEFKRVTDDLADVLEGLDLPAAETMAFGGLFICSGAQTQTIASEGTVTLNQWLLGQPSFGFVHEAGDQFITIPRSAVYRIDVNLSYDTTARNGEVFMFDVVSSSTGPIPGLCTRVQHQHAQQSVYSMCITLLVALQDGDNIEVVVEAGVLDQPRTLAIKHGSFTITQVSPTFVEGGG